MSEPEACVRAESRDNGPVPIRFGTPPPPHASLFARAVQGILKTDSAFASAVTSTLLAQAVTLLLALCLDVMIARRLGPAVRGVYALAVLAASLTVQALDFGFATATTYFLARKPRRTGAILGNNAILVLGTLLATAAASLTLAHIRPRGMALSALVDPAMLAGIAALVTATMAYNYTMAALYGQQSIASANRMPLLYIAAFLLAAAASAWMQGPSVAGLLAAGAFGRAAALVWGLAAIRWPLRCTASRRVFACCWRFALREYASNLTTLVAYRADQFIVAAFAGTAELGLYAVAASITERLNLLPGAIASVLLPRVAAGGARDALAHTGRLLRGTLCCALAAAGLLAVSCPFLIRVLYGGAYSGVVAPILLLLPGTVAMAAGKLASSHLLGQGKPGGVLAGSLIAALVTTALDFLLIPRFGIAGAAAASSVGYGSAAAFQVAGVFEPRTPALVVVEPS